MRSLDSPVVRGLPGDFASTGLAAPVSAGLAGLSLPSDALPAAGLSADGFSAGAAAGLSSGLAAAGAADGASSFSTAGSGFGV